MSNNNVVMQRVAQLGVAVVTLGVVGYLTNRAHSQYMTDLKVFEAANKLVSQEQIDAYTYYFTMDTLRKGYAFKVIFSGASFSEYWAGVMTYPNVVNELKKGAAAAGKTLEQVRLEVVMGTYERVAWPWPELPRSVDYTMPGVVLTVGIGLELAIWQSSRRSPQV